MNPLFILIAIIYGMAFLLALIVAPKWLALTLWPVIMVYPHAITYGMLPLNVGFDDIYISVVFVLLTLRLGMPRFSFPLKVAIIFYAIMFISNMTGTLTAPISIAEAVFKESLKNLVLIMFTWTVLLSVKEEKDIRSHILSFLISMTVASALAVADYFKMPFAQLFYIVPEGRTYFRACGPFLSPDSIGVTTMVPVFICLVGLTIGRRTFIKTILGIGAAIIGSALFVSGSRLGWMGFLFGLLFMFLTTRRRFVLIIGGIALVFATARLLGTETWQNVLRLNIERTLYGVGAGTAGRLGDWLIYIRNPYFAMLICGRGLYASGALGLPQPHNGYLDALFLFGLAGALFFGIVIYRIVKLSRWLARNDYDPLLSAVAQGFFIGVLGWLVTAIPGDTILIIFWRYSFFFTIAMLWSRQEILQAMGFLVPYPNKNIYLYHLEDYSYEQEVPYYPI